MIVEPRNLGYALSLTVGTLSPISLGSQVNEGPNVVIAQLPRFQLQYLVSTKPFTPPRLQFVLCSVEKVFKHHFTVSQLEEKVVPLSIRLPIQQ